MPRRPALTATQEKKLRAQVRAGADLVTLQAHAVKLKIKASRSKLGELVKSERDLMAAEAAGEKPGRPPSLDAELPGWAEDLKRELASLRGRLDAELPGWAEDLKRELASLRGRLDVLMTMPKVKLSDAATGAVYIAQTMMGDPTLDPNVKAKIMAQLPDLIESANKAKESERGGGDDELGV